MGFDYSLSFHEGDNFSLEHDNREKISPNVNPERISENITLDGGVSLQKFYEETFQNAYEEYIQKQIKNRHADRVKDWPKTYYEFIKEKQIEQEKIKRQMKKDGKHVKEIHEEDKYQRIAKQLIVQVGNIDDFENLSPQEQQELRMQMRDILREYMETFQKENLNFRVVNAVIHMDEVSLSPHLHLTYVPVANPKKGLSIQNSINGALKAMGFESDTKKDDEGVYMTAQMKWQKKERDRMVGIAQKFGLHIGYESGKRVQTRTLQDYQRDRQKERDAELAAREAQVAEQEQNLDHRETVVQKKEERIDAKVEQVNAFLQTEKQRVDEVNQALNEREIAIEERESILQAEAEATVKKIEVAVSEAIASVKPAPGKRMEDYSPSKMKKGHRLVPDKDLETYIDRSWYRPEHIKKTMQNVMDKFNELPFVQAARETIYQLEQQVLQLKKTIQSLRQKNKEQQVLLDKAKEIQLGTMGKTMYDHLKDEVAKDRERVSEMYDHDNDILGR